MKLDYLETLLLYCMEQLKGQRTTASVFHLLKGKKSSQTIQDGHLFRLTEFFQTIPTLRREKFSQSIETLHKQNLIEAMKEDLFSVTDKGRQLLTVSLDNRPIPIYLNGWRYHHVTVPFWQRLSLLIQVCSHLIHEQSSYIPIQRDTEVKRWIRTFVQSYSGSREDLADNLLEELTTGMESNRFIDPRTVILRFTGYRKIGLTAQQAAVQLEMDPLHYSHHFQNVLHYLLMISEQHRDKYKLLHQLSEGEVFPFTASTRKTYELINRGYSIEKIMAIRRLKRGTIEDHLIEIALTDEQFPIEMYVAEERKQQILKTANMLRTKKLKKIKQQLTDVSYFEIRLVLAKYGDRQ